MVNGVCDTCNGHSCAVPNIAEQPQAAAQIEYRTRTHTRIPKHKLSLSSLVHCADPTDHGNGMQRHQVQTLHQHVRRLRVLCPSRQPDSIVTHVHQTRSCAPSRLVLLHVVCTHPISSVLSINHGTHHDMLSVKTDTSAFMTTHRTREDSLLRCP